MSKKKIAIGLMVIGAIFRLTINLCNVPNNSFDDYLEVIVLFANNVGERPLPWECWQCYQPPLYFLITGVVFELSSWLTGSDYTAWEIVQLLSALFSIGTLVVVWKTITLNSKEVSNYHLVALSLIVVFPRDLYTSAMISSDSMLVFSVSTAIFFFLKWNQYSRIKYLTLMCAFVIMSALTKQHGLITLILPLTVLTKSFVCTWRQRQTISPVSALIASGTIVISGLDEFWRCMKTGILLVSNQDYFDYASNQPPGKVEFVEFFSFRLLDLIAEPLLNEKTCSSFWTVLFANTWYDYEWRYVLENHQLTELIGAVNYVFGAMVSLVFIYGIYHALKGNLIHSYAHFTLVVIGLLFLFVPMVQTLRFPYFSSMKSLFLIPGVVVFIWFFYLSVQRLKVIERNKVSFSIISLMLVIGILHLAFICTNLHLAVNQLSGPLWNLPVNQ
ncbi:hypothetical protein OAL15_02400 [Flavobacteriales bacterium]|nr:hypothetical protein [Flavobacteriales bacterium]